MSDGAHGVTADRLQQVLQAALTPAELAVRDDSHLHAGHAGAREGRHFSVRVVSAAFDGLSRVARHRLVYDAVRPLIAEGIHALAIDARTPAEALR
jgi:BolA protein